MCWSLGIVCRAVVHNFVKMNGYSVHGGDTMWMCQASAHNWLLFKVNWRCNYIAGAHSLRFFMKHERTGASTPSHSCTPAHDTGGTTSHFPLSGEVGILSSNFIMKIVQTAARLGLDSWEWMEFSFFFHHFASFFPCILLYCPWRPARSSGWPFAEAKNGIYWFVHGSVRLFGSRAHKRN